MTAILRTVEFLALGVWVGAILFLSLVVAPGAFSILPSRDLAGAMVAMALARVHLLGYVASALFLGASVTRSRSLSALSRPAAVAAILMLLLTLVSQRWVSPRMAGLRAEMGSVDATPADHPLRVEFNRLHQISVGLEMAVLLLGLAATFLAVREKPF
jgi:hypothetical protein